VSREYRKVSCRKIVPKYKIQVDAGPSLLTKKKSVFSLLGVVGTAKFAGKGKLSIGVYYF